MKAVILICLTLLFSASTSAAAKQQDQQPLVAAITSFPIKVPKSCKREKLFLYNSCIDQIGILNDAKAAAKAEGKAVLVVYGADWCIWCHVFDAYIHGQRGTFWHPFDGDIWEMSEVPSATMNEEADALAKFVADNFVIAHLWASWQPKSQAILVATKAVEHDSNAVPLIYSLNEEGHFFAKFDGKSAESRRDTDDPFRGYNRKIMLENLRKLRVQHSPSQSPL